MKKLQCTKCHFWFTTRAKNYEKHTSVCNGDYKPPQPHLNNCTYCKRSLENFTPTKKANHIRWCDLNPKTEYYKKSAAERIKRILNNKDFLPQILTPEAREKAKQGIKEAWKRGCYNHVNHQTFLGKTHTKKAKEIIRQKALISKHRRLKRGTVMYKGVLLDSSWELALAQRLDELNVKWIRPEPIQWNDEQGIKHHYFPDFYLPDFDLYLDPKNPAAIKAQKNKLIVLKKMLPNLIIIESLEQCNLYTPVSQRSSKA